MPDHQPSEEHKGQLKSQRWQLLAHVQQLLEKPMTFLAFVWLALIILSFTTREGRLLRDLSYAIWAVFVLDFLLEFTIAPHKIEYLKRHWLTAVSLAAPALSIFRVFGIFQALFAAHSAGYVSLLQLISSYNRGMHALQQTMKRRGVGYVLAITVIVLFAGAAGMLAFENPQALISDGQAQQVQQGAGLHSYADALWWTAMVLTTMGSQYWPLTPQGRILCWFLALYAISVFGYLTATIASHFIGQDANPGQPQPQTTGGSTNTDRLHAEIEQLSKQITALMAELKSVSDERP